VKNILNPGHYNWS